MADANISTYRDKRGNWWYADMDKGEILHEKPYKTEEEAKKGMADYMMKQKAKSKPKEYKTREDQMKYLDENAK